MSEFSKEYLVIKGHSLKGDFCYLDEFNKLKEGETFYSICEGLGLYGVTRKENAPFLIVNIDKNSVEYFSFINNLTAKIN